jgi:tetratricopeptide (TPR) repeat protein
MRSIDTAKELKGEAIQLADEKGQPEEAIAKLKDGIALIKNDQAHNNELAEIQHLIAMISLNLEDTDQAWEYFSEALKTNNGKNIKLSNRCNLNLGLLSYRDEEYKGAIKIFGKVKGTEGLNPIQVDMYYTMMGVSYLRLEKYRRALKYLFKALEYPYEDDRNFEVLHHLGSTYYYMKDYKNALKYYEASINKKPDQSEGFKQLTLLRMAYLYMYKEEYEKAIQLCEEIEQKQDINIKLDNLYITRGRCHSRLSQVMQALKYFEKAWELKDELTEGWRDRIKQWLIDYYTKVGNQERVSELEAS